VPITGPGIFTIKSQVVRNRAEILTFLGRQEVEGPRISDLHL